ncbi:cytochrome P450 [Rhodovulum bhavnagarense]|uniref:Cytochrome P450 n=1 Tax=Rhodovulum bhavnagarense TaxID=992286 RepID=A0A4R2RFG5_9RHOB|nr:cytochrome P450 [Rhodovulum bhavnagarense]TCP61633.1 cytochrome P450 [Rhodovulum bhavnagarense]
MTSDTFVEADPAQAGCPFARPQPVKPPARPGRLTPRVVLRLLRQDILAAQPQRLFRAWMAEFRSPFFTSFLCNDPDIVDKVLTRRPRDFPKSMRLFKGLTPLLGHSIFITNGREWERQRRIIDPAFDGGRIRDVFPVMWDSTRAGVARLKPLADGRPLDVEAQTSHIALDVIFRALFSLPVESDTAMATFEAFRAHQASRPMINTGTLLPLPRWMPGLHSRGTTRTARQIRGLIRGLVDARAAEIAAGTAPDDLATRIMTTADPEDGSRFTPEEMVDQVGIFLLAGHETSAAALAWALYLLALFPDWQDRVAAEAAEVIEPDQMDFGVLTRLKLSRAVFRESMRLYPPVPMYLRETTAKEQFRGRDVPKGAQIVISPWHLHRHERIWDRPDDFDPGRWDTPEGRESMRQAYIPFSAGPRVCPGAAFAMAEGPLILSELLRHYRVGLVEGREPMPVAQLTVRGQDGIWLTFTPRGPSIS